MRQRLWFCAIRLGRTPSEMPDMSMEELAELDAVLMEIEEREDERAMVAAEAVAALGRAIAGRKPR